MRAGVTGLRETGLGVWWFGCWRQLSRQYTLPFSSLCLESILQSVEAECGVLRVQRVARDLMCIRLPEGSNHHWWVEAYLCMSRRVLCVVFGPCIRAGRPINMGRMCYVFEGPCWCRATNLIGGHVGPCWSRRDDPPGRVGCLRGSGPCGFTNPLFPLSMVSEGSDCVGIRASYM